MTKARPKRVLPWNFIYGGWEGKHLFPPWSSISGDKCLRPCASLPFSYSSGKKPVRIGDRQEIGELYRGWVMGREQESKRQGFRSYKQIHSFLLSYFELSFCHWWPKEPWTIPTSATAWVSRVHRNTLAWPLTLLTVPPRPSQIPHRGCGHPSPLFLIS